MIKDFSLKAYKVTSNISWGVDLYDNYCSVEVYGFQRSVDKKIILRKKFPKDSNNTAYNIKKSDNGGNYIWDYDTDLKTMTTFINEIISLMENDYNYSEELVIYKTLLRKEKINSI